MTGASAFLGVFWGLINHRYRRIILQKDNQHRRLSYQNYLKESDHYLSECRQKNQQILLTRFPSGNELLQKNENGRYRRYWNRSPLAADYLFLRLAMGRLPFQMKLSMEGKKAGYGSKDPLLLEAEKLLHTYETIEQVPAGIHLGEAACIGITGEQPQHLLLGIFLQLSARFHPGQLKMAFFYRKEYSGARELADCVKWLPHIWQEDGRYRFLAGDEREQEELLPLLGEAVRKEREAFYVVVIWSASLLLAENGLSRLLSEKPPEKLCVIVADPDREQLPGSCQLVLSAWEKGKLTCSLTCSGEREYRPFLEAVREECDRPSAESYMRSLSLAESRKEREGSGCTGEVSFLELYGCACAEELNCPARWRANRTGERMRVPIGRGKANRLIFLDIHEKFHGPHGLIAGTTGSGKSELLKTYLLSLAVSFSPEEVNFFIIDYKGGGMGDELKDLPHCAGIISNLSGRQIKRALASIKSENRRRQRLFHQAGVSHVEEYAALYREGAVKEPVPHLILVVDEFAELKKEEPAFMQEMISVAQVGRSLGVHLILATQKPAGTVDDRIWSNTRFRLCLRVADKQDSMDMLHRPEAAWLTEAGRGYMQVGNDELFQLFQTGYSRAPCRQPKDRGEVAALVTENGRRLRPKREKIQKQDTQLAHTIKQIQEAARQTGYQPARALWLPELPERLSLGACPGAEIEQESRREIRLCAGLYDDPDNQCRKSFFYEPEKEGHLCLIGGPATGKSTFLQTLLWQLCRKYSPQELQLLLIAPDSMAVSSYEAMPHCLGRLKRTEEAPCFFYHLERVWKERKKILSGMNLKQFERKSGRKIPILFLVIDNLGAFRQMTENGYDLLLAKLAGEGIQCGIYLLMTGLGVNSSEIPARLFEKCSCTLALEMSEKMQYGEILRRYQIPVQPREGVRGRGLCRQEERILEFQVPLFTEEEDYERIGQIEALAEKQSRHFAESGGRIRRFPMIPERPDFEQLWQDGLAFDSQKEGLPIGYQQETGWIQTIDEAKGFPFLISGKAGSGKRNLLLSMAEGMQRQGYRILWFERYRQEDEQVQLLPEGTLCIREAGELLRYLEEPVEKEICLCIARLDDFCEMLAGGKEAGRNLGLLLFGEDEKAQRKRPLAKIIAAGAGDWERRAVGTALYDCFLNRQWGIHLGGNAGSQRVLSFEDLGYGKLSKAEKPGIGYLKTGVGSKTRQLYLPLRQAERREDDIFGCDDPETGSDL